MSQLTSIIASTYPIDKLIYPLGWPCTCLHPIEPHLAAYQLRVPSSQPPRTFLVSIDGIDTASQQDSEPASLPLEDLRIINAVRHACAVIPVARQYLRNYPYDIPSQLLSCLMSEGWSKEGRSTCIFGTPVDLDSASSEPFPDRWDSSLPPFLVA